MEKYGDLSDVLNDETYKDWFTDALIPEKSNWLTSVRKEAKIFTAIKQNCKNGIVL